MRENKNLLILLAALLLFFSCGNKSAVMTSEDEDRVISEVNQAFDDLVAAARKIDVEKYLEYFDKRKFTSLNEDGTVTHTFAEFEQNFRSQFGTVAGYESLKFKKVKITVINRVTAVLVNEYDAKVILKSGNTINAAGAGTQVWSKTGGEWKMVSVSSSAK